MNSFMWTCRACEMPNVVVVDPFESTHITLECKKCGHPGHVDTQKKTVTQFVREPYIDTISTSMVPRDLYATNVYVEGLVPWRV